MSTQLLPTRIFSESFYSPSQLAAYFGVSVNELDRLAEEGAISVMHVGGIKIYGVLDELKEYWRLILELRKTNKEREGTA